MEDKPRYSCQSCQRDDLSLTKNGRVRSHTADGKKSGPDNPACPGGSNFPVQDTEFHTHVFADVDDENGHVGKFCTVDGCDMIQPDDAMGMSAPDLGPVPTPPSGAPQGGAGLNYWPTERLLDVPDIATLAETVLEENRERESGAAQGDAAWPTHQEVSDATWVDNLGFGASPEVAALAETILAENRERESGARPTPEQQAQMDGLRAGGAMAELNRLAADLRAKEATKTPANPDLKPTATEYRNAQATVRSDSVSAEALEHAQEVMNRAVTYGVRADDPNGECTCGGKKGTAVQVHNAACPQYVPRVPTTTGGPNPNRAPLPTSNRPTVQALPTQRPETPTPGEVAVMAPPQKAGEAAQADHQKKADSAAEAYLMSMAANHPRTARSSAPSTEADAAAFLMGGPSRVPAGPSAPSTEADAAAFLMGGDSSADSDDPADNRGTYFESRYDGDCDECGEHFMVGNEIRSNGDGGWQGRDCCGEMEDQGERTAPAVDRMDPMVRLKAKVPIRNGRYRAPHPETGKSDTPFTRVTTFVKLASDSFGLSQWSQRMAVLGLVHTPELGRKVRDLLEKSDLAPYEVAKTERERLNDWVEEAKDGAGANLRAAKGTKLHTFTEKLDRKEIQPGEVPQEFRPDAVAYLDAIDRFGLRPHAHLVERSTVVVEMGVLGTFDRDYEITRRITATLPGKGKNPGREVVLEPGEFVVGDVKTGADLSYSEMEIATQIGLYAKGQNRHGIATPVLREDGKGYTWEWRRAGECAMDGTDWVIPKVREDVGIVVHIPYKEATPTVYLVDLEEGWKNALVCLDVQERQRRKKVFTALPLSAVEGAPAPRTTMPTAAELTGPSVTGVVHTGPKTAPAADIPPWPASMPYWLQQFAVAGSRQALQNVAVEAAKGGMPQDVLEMMLFNGLERFAVEETAAPKTPAPGTTWSDRFAAVGSYEELDDVADAADDAGMPPERVATLKRETQARLDAVNAERIGATPVNISAVIPSPTATMPGTGSWSDQFAAVTSLPELNALCKEALASGMPKERVLAYHTEHKDRMVPTVEQPPATGGSWADRFTSVASLPELNALCKEAQAAGMPRERVLAYHTAHKERLTA